MVRGGKGVLPSRALRAKYLSGWLEGRGLWQAHLKMVLGGGGGEVLGPQVCDQEIGLHSKSREGPWADLSSAGCDGEPLSGGLNNRDLLSQFWRLGVQDQGVGIVW